MRKKAENKGIHMEALFFNHIDFDLITFRDEVYFCTLLFYDGDS